MEKKEVRRSKERRVRRVRRDVRVKEKVKKLKTNDQI
jgi:hypothetical protein